MADGIDPPNFEGHPDRHCGEHRTVGPHRAWCYDCTEWCYPGIDAECRGCRLPALVAEVERLRADNERLREELDWAQTYQQSFEQRLAAALAGPTKETDQ